jgi:ketosteroid isomerase-like protein
MSRENVELIKRAYQAFAQGGFDEAVQMLDPDVEWIPPNLAPTAGTHRGRAGAKAELREFLEPFEDYRWESRDFIDAGDRVVVIGYQSGRGRISGVEVGQEQVHIWTVRDGKIVRMQMFDDRAEAFEAAGLSEQDAHAGSS